MIGNCPNFILNAGDTHQLTANVAPFDATDKNVIWSSSNSEVATVDDNGLISAKSQGSVKITITTNDGAYTNTCNIGVMGTTSANENYQISNPVKIYPNPASHRLYLEFLTMDMNREIKIFDSRGQIIYRENACGLLKQIDIKKLKTTGVLAVQINSGQNCSVHKIFVREN